MLKRFLVTCLMLLLSLALIVGCATTPQDTSPGSTTPGDTTGDTNGSDTADPGDTTVGTGGDGGRDTLIVGVTQDVGTFNPHYTTLMLEFRLLMNIYDALVRTNHTTGEITPQLAESYTVSDDGLTYTFNLRQDVKFHNGDPFNADNIMGNYEIWGESLNVTALMAMIESVNKVDDYTVEMKLHEPSAVFLVHLGDTAIVHDGVYLANPDGFGEAPVGTGAYMLTARHIGATIEFTRFDDHFRGPAAIREVTLKILPDANTLAVALEMGEIDYSESVVPASVPLLEVVDSLNVNVLPGIQVNYLSFNTERAPFNDVRVRRAIAHSIDRQMIIDMAREGLGTPTNVAHLPSMPFAPQGYPVYEYNPDKARELLAEAGFPNGLVVDEPLLCAQWGLLDSQAIQSLLAGAGVDVEISPMEFAAWAPMVFDGDFLMAFSGWNATSLHPDFFVQLYISEMIGINNAPRYSNPVLDDLALRALQTLDPVEAQGLYNEIYSIIQEDVPSIVLYIAPFIVTHNNQLTIQGANAIANPYYNMSW